MVVMTGPIRRADDGEAPDADWQTFAKDPTVPRGAEITAAQPHEPAPLLPGVHLEEAQDNGAAPADETAPQEAE